MKKYLIVLAPLAFLISSCSTYYMTATSLKEQLQKIDPDNIEDRYDFRLGLAGVALKGGKNFYNGIDSIKCTDKNGKEKTIPVRTNTGIRLTEKSGKRQILYFDSLFLRDTLIYGSKSHFITLPVDPINVNNIEKIEVQ